MQLKTGTSLVICMMYDRGSRLSMGPVHMSNPTRRQLKYSVSFTTSPVVLKPINTDGEANDSYTEVSSNVQQRTISETLKYGIQNPRMHNIIPRVELLPLTDIHNWKTDIAVVWETHCPCHQEQTLASVPHSTSNEVEQSENSMFTGEENREIVVMLDQQQTINQLHQIFQGSTGLLLFGHGLNGLQFMTLQSSATRCTRNC